MAYEDVIGSLLFDITEQPGSTRADALRGQDPNQPPMPMPGVGGAPDPTQFGAMPPPQPDWGGLMGMPFGPGGPQGAPALPQATQVAPPPQNAPQQPASPVGGPSALPRATGGGGYGGGRGGVYQEDPTDPLVAEGKRLEAQQQEDYRRMEAAYQPADRSEMERAFAARGEQAPQNYGLAALAGEAGETFKPYQAQFLKQAAELGGPMKMTGGTMTPTGWIEDPGHAQELAATRAAARLKATEAALQNNIMARERRRLQQERLDAQAEMRRATQAAIAARTGGGGEGKILPVKAVTDLTEGTNKLATMQRLSSEFKPEYGGVAGGFSNIVGTMPGVTTGAREFWRNYSKEAELIERHGLFGSALTPTELASWRAADIQPWMDADAIQRNLDRRAQVLADHYNNAVQRLGGSGYNVSAFPPEAGGSAPGGSAGTRASGSVTPRVTNDAEYNALPSGTRFVDPNGQTRVKP